MATSEGAVRVPEIVITPRRGLFHLGLRELWRSRELGLFFVWRDVKVRYKQTVIGAAWAVISPVVLMVVFTLVFGKLRGSGAASVPTPVWYFSALLPWTYFSGSLQAASSSVINAQQVVQKIYFPRLMLPLASVLPGVVDFVMSFAVLAVLMAIYHVPFTTRLAIVPVVLVISAITAFSAGMWLSATNALYRDVREATPFLVQVLLFTSPVLLARAKIPPWFRPYYGLNPMAGVIEASRWAVTGVGKFPWDFVVSGLVFLVVMTLGGLIYFRRVEDLVIDVV
jgi:lipopolysaccharide transport system permease protein